MKKRADGKKRVELMNRLVFLRLGEKLELKIPLAGFMVTLLFIVFTMFLMTSEIQCGGIKHQPMKSKSIYETIKSFFVN